jgi:hypothetical protein
MAEPAFEDDPFERLRARIQAAEAAAVRLAAEARAARGGDGATGGDGAAAGSAPGPGGPEGATGGPSRHEPPPRGWEVPGRSNAGDDLALLGTLIQSVRGLVPPDLQQRLADAIRDLLVALRALIDWYLERDEHRRGRDLEVEDIPID